MTPVPGVRCTTIFSDPPGVPTGLAVTVEHGDVVLLVELVGVPFCQIVLAAHDAREFDAMLGAALDARQWGGEP